MLTKDGALKAASVKVTGKRGGKRVFVNTKQSGEKWEWKQWCSDGADELGCTAHFELQHSYAVPSLSCAIVRDEAPEVRCSARCASTTHKRNELPSFCGLCVWAFF